MDFLSLLRTIGALGVVLGMLVGALWVVRRYDLKLPQKWLNGQLFAGMGQARPDRRLELIERLAIDPRRSVVLIRRDYREISLLISPEGVVMLDSAPCIGPVSPKSTPKAPVDA
ncbi:flagellar protein FliO/FliZ [Novosphingobium sp. PhB57]|jgi:flagellar protein FliO/FliZ|uniref:FliO/MopB family protein n=1 Tax=unclassified Novosphingobium TaxID=2644732 RepID=UPI00104E0D3E|nr:flagellar biosynthetic protein FliO [Novosphingobium sp. PhB57]TCU56165.1 flagellar protein FliO/FliZ [Novosphingobium sp. PhB57]